MPESPTDTRFGSSSIARSAALVMAMTVASGLLGVLRNSVIASRFGTSSDYAAYLAVFGLLDFIYRLVIGGALGSAFIPVFTAYLARKDEVGAWKLASTILNLALVGVLAVAGVVALAAPWLVRYIVAPGFSPEQQALTVRLTRLLLIQPVLLGVGGLAMATLNSFRRFLLTALAPLAYNLGIIVGAYFLAPLWGIDGLVAGVWIGAALYIPVLLPGLLLCRARYCFSWDWKETGVREVGRLMLPRLVGAAAFQINFVAINSLATFSGPLAVTAIGYAYQIFFYPLNILGISLATVAFPTFSTLANEGQMDELRRTVVRMLRLVFFLSLPAAALLLVLRVPVVTLLYERGSFTAADTAAAAYALLFYMLGLTSGCVTEIVVRAFYALHDTRTPVAVGVSVVLLNIALGAGLRAVMDYPGLALSFTISNTLGPLALLFLLQRRIAGTVDRTLLWSGLRSLGAVALAGGAVVLLLPVFERLMPGAGLHLQFVRLALLSGLGGGLYLGASFLLRSPEVREAWDLLRRRVRA